MGLNSPAEPPRNKHLKLNWLETIIICFTLDYGYLAKHEIFVKNK